jgi:ribosomal protein S14
MIKAKILNIFKDKNKRVLYNKYEIKKIIFKSIIQNKNIKPIIRAKAIRKLCKLTLKSSISKQNNNICLKTGKIGSVYKTFNLSRHYLKTISLSGNLQNVKIASW